MYGRGGDLVASTNVEFPEALVRGERREEERKVGEFVVSLQVEYGELGEREKGERVVTQIAVFHSHFFQVRELVEGREEGD